ncbi:tRNA (N6-threonylcarbamoyladenosine(37)-N6)-methyltransferase TrmO [Carnimonas nigrificans]|uniref:tRNA (N6-threonylcarbamoyladenosine(37)-N6)-methyltransferase TrmO n=1 Tax=Carnimonas nigrificans TaxID=64323 RepID=UPI00047115B5|nr:tRNA (N6-threonylcarbamoyladenosine(37)-N6)-methyltransferase TrmO [Carnimonas nigrificans]
MCSTSFSLTPIATIDGCYPDKFGVPRQPGLAPSAQARVTLREEFADPDAVRGLENFSHLWLTFIFHLNPSQWRPLVRPPRLGGNRKIGVFASRATFRPNRLGLSLVELLEVKVDHGVQLLIRGHDLVNGTPVVDIKPYLPWSESIPDARAGFAPAPPSLCPVTFSAAARQTLAQQPDPTTLEVLITEVLGQDPRPAYHSIKNERRYAVRLGEYDIGFRIIALTAPHQEGEERPIAAPAVEVLDITRLPSANAS